MSDEKVPTPTPKPPPEPPDECPKCHYRGPYRDVRFRAGKVILQCNVCGHKWEEKARGKP
jgi:hypothetical protein